MKFLGRLTVVVVVLVVVAAIVSVMLPGHVHVERQTSVQAPPASVFALLNDLRNSKKWSPWLARDPNTDLTFSGAQWGVGANMSWRSDHGEVGSGSQTIVASEPDKLVRVALEFDGQGSATAYFRLKPEGQGTELTWGFDMEIGANPVMRYMGLMFERWIGPDYEQGLANIKRVLESGG
jgi:carbon monoxide dehydrogenase subunit G